jgi:glycosyltransferase involved in cell wall biosynthesis
MKITAIIPTMNRPKPLGDLLDSILVNTIVPEQTVVVDQSDSKEILDLVTEMRPAFAALGSVLEYYWRDQKSLTAARNFGVSRARGDLVSFFDDDLILSPRYFLTIGNIFAANPHTMGVQGSIANDPKHSRASNLLRKVFFADHVGKEFRIIPSFRAQVMDPAVVKLRKVVQANFLNGVCTYRSSVFQEFSFDEKLTKYSLGEDRDFSYRVGKRYPGSLAVAADAEVIHVHSTEARLGSRDYLFMQAAHSAYLFSKNIRQTTFHKGIFWWHWFGRLITGIGQALKPVPGSRQSAKDLLDSFVFMIRHGREFAGGDLSALYAQLGLSGRLSARGATERREEVSL